MKKFFKAPIILSLLAASAFSIIGQEPARASNTLVERYHNCRLMKIKNKVFKVKAGYTSTLLFETSSREAGKAWMRSEPYCRDN